MSSRLVELLGRPNTASKEAVIRLYDHEVQGGTVVKPLVGAANDGPSDACVLKPVGGRGRAAIALSNGINPELGKSAPYRMAVSVVDEAIRNAVAVGADPTRIALLDNFCWGDPRKPETLGSLVEAARGCHDAALHYQTPFISGKDSLNNEYMGSDGLQHAIPPTLLISAVGIIADVDAVVTMDLKGAGNTVYLLGSLEKDRKPVQGLVPFAPDLYRALHRAIRQGLVQACHDLSEGGLAAAAAEMCIGGRLGMDLKLSHSQPEFGLFGEVNAGLLVEVEPGCLAQFGAVFEELPCERIGAVTQTPRLKIACANLGVEGRIERIVNLAVDDLVRAWGGNLEVGF